MNLCGKYYLSISLAILMLNSACADHQRKQQPIAKDGVIDLSRWDFASDGPVELRGEWRFAWQEFVEPASIEDLMTKYQGSIQLPAVWTSQPNPLKIGEYLPATGYGTYILRVKMGSQFNVTTEPFGIKLNNVFGGAETEIRDQQGITLLTSISNGKPSVKKETEIPVMINNISKIVNETSGDLLILMKVSNYRDIRGGTYWAPQWGTFADVKREWLSQLLRSLFLIGALVIFTLYHLILYIQRKEDTVSLAFCFFCAAICIREIIMSNLFQHLGIGKSTTGFEIIQTIEYLTMEFMVITAGFFILRMLPGKLFSQIYKIWFVFFGVILSIFTLSVSCLTFSNYLTLYQAYLLSSCLLAIGHVSYQSFQNNRIAQWILLSLCIIVLGSINDILHANGIIESGFYGPYSFLGFVLLQSAIISKKSARAYHKAQYLSENLKKEVKDRTIELEQKTEIAIAARKDSDQARKTAICAKQESDQAREESEQLRRQAESQAEKLKELDQAKTSFFQNISHELRTPLTLIMNPLEHLTQKNPEDKDAQVAAKNSRRLLRLVNQLLDFQKLEAGKKTLKLSPINLSEFILVCANYFTAACSHKHIDFQVSINGDTLDLDSVPEPLWIMGEIDALEKITFNYLANALKYTPYHGSIELGLNRINSRIRLRITDNGSGIAIKDQEKLFQVFTQVDASTTRSHEGTGLGLALVKSLTEEMDGTVGVDSELGTGSNFWAEFDLLKTAAPIIRVLIVEDDETLRQTLMDEIAEKLDLEYNEIYGKGNAEEALACMEENIVSCVIIDYNLPSTNGLDLLNKISKISPKTYRILITADITFDLIDRGANNHLVDQFFHKTTDHNELVANLLDTVKAHTIDHSQMLTPARPVIDLLIVDDEEQILHTLRELFVDQLALDMTKVKVATNVKEAVRLMKKNAVRCVICDYHIGGDDGLTLLEDIGHQYPETKKILMTGQADISVIQWAVNHEAVDRVFYKPPDQDSLIDTVGGFINNSTIEEEQVASDFIVKPWLIPETASQIKGDETDGNEPPELVYSDGEETRELILVVDDLTDMRDLIKTNLKSKNYRVITAENGEKALVKAKQYNPHLIITDWMMPVMDGPALITKINEDPELSSTPTILLTAKSDEESRLIGTETGADGFLGKPFNEKELTSLVKNLLSLKANEYEVEALNIKLTENVLKRYLPPDLVDQIVTGKTSFEDKPKAVTATILFSDLVGFTDLSGELRVSRISDILNSYLEAMNEVIFEFGGTIDKFIGDSIMVIFGAPTETVPREQAKQAAQCALAMQTAMEKLNQEWQRQNIPELLMRIGIHQGPVMVGNFGSKRRSDYTAIGSTVNKASRIEGSCEPGQVFISAEVCDFLDDSMAKQIGVFNLKGIKGSHNLYKLVD